MTPFWSLVAGMVAIALLFILPPLLRSARTGGSISQDELNTEVFRTQLDELQADLNSGKLDKDTYYLAKRDLEKEFLHDLRADDTKNGETVTRSGRWAAILVLVTIPLMAVLLYQQLGASKLIPVLQAQSAQGTQTAGTSQQGGTRDGSKMPPIEMMVDGLAARLQQQPDDLEGWVILARSYVSIKRFDEAMDAYAQAVRLDGDNPQILVDYAEAMGMANGNQLTGRPAEVLATALELDPRQPKALWLTGFVHYQNQDYEGALRYWQQLSGILPADSKDAATVAQSIQIEQEKLGQSPETATTGQAMTTAPATTTPTARASSSGATKQVSVQVQLDPALQGQTRPDETVFIFARATQGPRMPLAIVRKQVSDLPLTVTLDDSMAMTPAMVLSNFDAVTVGARVSRAGTAMAQSGDLQGTVSPVIPGAGEVIQLTISEVIP